MQKSRIFFSVCLYFLVISSFFEVNLLAQDTLKESRFSSWQSYAALEPTWKVVGNADIRRSLFRNSPIILEGFQLGVRYKGLYKFTLGYYQLVDETILNSFVSQLFYGSKDKEIVEEEIKMRMISACFTYHFVNTKYWEIGFPIEAGYARARDIRRDSNGKYINSVQSTFLPLQAGVLFHWKATRWAGLRTTFGVRQIVTHTNYVQFSQGFDGLYYGYGVVVYLGKVYKDLIKPPKK